MAAGGSRSKATEPSPVRRDGDGDGDSYRPVPGLATALLGEGAWRVNTVG